MEAPDARCSDDGRLPYGLAADGKLARVADVQRGLACGCRCPACGSPLLARKGEVKVAHFAHHANRECKGTWETKLHLLAKEVLLESSRVLLPEVVATFGGANETIAGPTWFTYGLVRPEVGLESIRPDIVLTGRGRELLVEVAVTHFCGPEKVGELRQRDLPAIEIDLSAVPRLASRGEHAAAILEGAPRQWLHNAKIRDAVAELREAADRDRAERLERQKAAWALEAERLVAAASGGLEAFGIGWASEARDAGLGGLLGREVDGDFCFCVPRETWQARVVAFAREDSRGGPFDVEGVHARLVSAGLIRSEFDRNFWSEGEVEVIRERLPSFGPPRRVITAYINLLAADGFVWSPGDGFWYVADPGPETPAEAQLDLNPASCVTSWLRPPSSSCCSWHRHFPRRG